MARNEKIWRCDCGGSHFISIKKYFDEPPYLAVECYEQYDGWLDRIRSAINALRGESVFMSEVMLDQQTAKEIVAVITELASLE